MAGEGWIGAGEGVGEEDGVDGWEGEGSWAGGQEKGLVVGGWVDWGYNKKGGRGRGGGWSGMGEGVGEEDGVEWLGRGRVVGAAGEGEVRGERWSWNGWEGEGGRGCGEGREGLH